MPPDSALVNWMPVIALAWYVLPILITLFVCKRAAGRAMTSELQLGWRHSCLAPLIMVLPLALILLIGFASGGFKSHAHIPEALIYIVVFGGAAVNFLFLWALCHVTVVIFRRMRQ